jgi:integrase
VLQSTRQAGAETPTMALTMLPKKEVSMAVPTVPFPLFPSQQTISDVVGIPVVSPRSKTMKRDREQKGSVVRIGEYWCVRYADWVIQDGQRIRKQGLTHKLTPVLQENTRLKRPPKYVEKLQEEYMERVNGSRNAPERCYTMAQFAKDVWIPFVENTHASSTLTVYRYYWDHILKPYCGDRLVRDFNTAAAQFVLYEIARQNPKMRKATLHKLKSMLSGMFKLAIQKEYRPGPNPIRETTLPKAPGPTETHAHYLRTIREILSLVPDTCKVIISLAAYAGLSKSEIQGLVWEAYNGRDIAVLSAVVNGKRGDTKTDARKDSIPLIEPVRRMLEMHRLKMGNPYAGVMFPTKNGTPLSLQNVYCDYIQPVLERCGECKQGKDDHSEADHEYIPDDSLPKWHGWHAFRRGLATNLHDLGVDDLTIQHILRHSDVAITRKSYIKTIPQQVVDAMAQLEAVVAGGTVQ